MRFDITRLNEKQFKISTTRDDCIELFKLFFRKKYDYRQLYNAGKVFVSEVLKTIIDCQYLQDNEKIILYNFVLLESSIKEDSILTKRYLGIKRIEKIKKLKELYPEVNILMII